MPDAAPHEPSAPGVQLDLAPRPRRARLVRRTDVLGPGINARIAQRGRAGRASFLTLRYHRAEGKWGSRRVQMRFSMSIGLGGVAPAAPGNEAS